MTDNQNSTPQPVQTQTQPQDNNLEQKLDQAAQTTKQKMHQDPAFSQTLAATPDLQDVVVDVEKELLEEILKNLQQNTMSADEAQKVAKEFLSYLPIQDQKDLLDKLYKLSQSNTETQSIFFKYAKTQEENETQKKLELMSQHIKQGNIEDALTVAKGGVTNA